ncbi:uncharacterized protein B0H18DRAFT_977196 [Fomitopsis serialis]|uniref:uncharacterized protein n=1 Tax=Fomitopsis serialis TaxID=139415 RepID=UPI002007F645|nr:uncharacterized protein B0H18DRAFT_977196 [Neoantrodia serialis]KAH9935764.1 hypothetical protein B0H18DRAFT_977196 [Neoantrodia serialis]
MSYSTSPAAPGPSHTSDSSMGGAHADELTPEVSMTHPTYQINAPTNMQTSLTSGADQAGQNQYGYYYAPGQTSSHNAPYAYYHMPSTAWGNAWSAPYGTANAYYPFTQPQAPLHPDIAQRSHVPPVEALSKNEKRELASPSPSPPPYVHKHWDGILRAFLAAAGLTQALRGFDADIVVMNPDWEQKKIPAALDTLVQSVLALKDRSANTTAEEITEGLAEETSLQDRKLQYLHIAHGTEPKSQTSVTREISKFLARNRARNDASNRQEFLQSLAEKRHGLQADTDTDSVPVPSCARTDAKTQDRDVQMKYDIAKNEDGPLRKTLKNRDDIPSTKLDERTSENGFISAARFPALEERLRNVESHLAVRYVPSPPKSLLDRLKFIEDHIVQLEKEYPPWAALHFNQPRRGWPPPPRPTPIIVPSHLTVITGEPQPAPAGASASEISESASSKGKGKSSRTKSSLHRAVMEKLEVQKAMHDLAGPADEG